MQIFKIPFTKCLITKKKGSVGTRRFILTNIQADNYGSSSGDDDGHCVYNGTGREISQYKYFRRGRVQAYETTKYMKRGGVSWTHKKETMGVVLGACLSTPCVTFILLIGGCPCLCRHQ